MSDSDTPVVASSRLRLFLVAGVRLFGVILALALTGMHSAESVFFPLPFPNFDGLPMVVTASVIIYNLLAGYLSSTCKSKSPLTAALIILDALVGAALTVYYGPVYLLLGFTLPLLTLGLYYGGSAALIGFVIGGLAYGLCLTWAFVGRLDIAENTAETWLLVKLAIVEICLAVLLLWLFISAIGEGSEKVANEERLKHDQELLFQEIQTTKQEVGKYCNELSSSENQVRTLRRDNDSLKDELEASIKRLNEVRVAAQEAEKQAEDQGREASQSARREKIQVQRQLALVQQRLERQERLFAVSRKLSGSLGLSDTLLALTEQLQAFLPCQSCLIFMLDEVNGHKELFAEVAASPYADKFRNYSLQIGEGAPGYAISKLTPFKIDNGAIDIKGDKIPTIVPEELSALVAPLVTPAQTIGVVYLGRAKENAFTEDDLGLLDGFAEMASVALGNSLLYQRAVSQGLNDALTGCHNGLFLEERMREEVKRGNRYMYSVSLILVDLDGFSQINEVLGREVGDCVLRETCSIIRQHTREVDVLARLDADDFALLLDHSDRAQSVEVGKRVLETISRHVFTYGGRKIRMTASIGVAGSPHDAANVEQLTMRAGAALQQAKNAGGNQVQLWSAGQ